MVQPGDGVQQEDTRSSDDDLDAVSTQLDELLTTVRYGKDDRATSKRKKSSDSERVIDLERALWELRTDLVDTLAAMKRLLLNTK
ncbi:hypothetical protein EVJ58_g3836, partial [Rhodofomes roseus]